jgi:hypothetical protein
VPDALFNLSRFIMSSIKAKEAPLGLGCTVALHHRSSTSYQIRE